MPPKLENEDEDLPVGETLDIGDDETSSVEDTEDGGAIVKLENDNQNRAARAHFANIVDDIPPAELALVVSELLEKIERDKEAREKRDKLYEEGLRRTGLGDDAPGGASFAGAHRVVHPMLVEACVDFSARAMKEIFPPAGPVKSKINGPRDKTKLEKADRKAAYMNWQSTEQMPEFRGELEQLSTQLPLGGAQYLKVSWRESRRRPCVEFVPIDDVYLPFAATNFYTAERKTHVQYITKSEYLRRIRAGMYRDVDLPSPESPEFSKASLANDKIEGRQDTSYNEDGLRTVFEVYTHIELDEEVAPYILTIDKSTGQALSLYRNWDAEDAQLEELDWIVEFPFVPWRGAYPIGLTHMIGGLSGAATGALRALLDSAHIQNVPSMIKLKGGPNGQTLNIQPTEVVEIEGGALVDDIRKLAMSIPFNPPSPTLFQLLGFLVDAGKGVVQTSFEKLSDQSPNAPVGTTLALIEQGMVVFSSIHSRLHASMGRVFKILHRINSAYLTEEDIAAQASGLEIKPSDFDDPMDVVPVSDPQIFSETQRFAQSQAIMQRAQLLPQLYDARKVEERFLRAMKVDDDILVPSVGEDDVDPVSENVAAAMGRPVYVLPKQDHLAHLKVHMAFLQSPLFGQNPAIVKTYLYPMVTHLRDTLLNYYLTETHNGVKIAQEKGSLEDDAEKEADMVVKVQQFVEQQLGNFGPVLAQLDAAAQQFAPKPPPMPQDNSLQVAQLNAQQRAQSDQARLQSAQQLEQLRSQHAGQMEQLKLQQAAQLKQLELQSRAQAMQADIATTQFVQQNENQRTQQELEARERMNTADNDTAMRLAAAELSTGEKFSVSTGTGINPGTR